MNSKIVKNKHGNMCIYVNGKIEEPFAYMTYQVEKGEFSQFKQAGFKLFCVSAFAGDMGSGFYSGVKPFSDSFWKAEDVYDFSGVKRELDFVIDNNLPGDVYILIRVNLNVPSWWKEKYPQEMARSFEGSAIRQSFSSKKWISDCEKVMSNFQKWINENGYSEYIIGWHIAGGETSEFFSVRDSQSFYVDYSECCRLHFIEWCESKYKCISDLNNSWKTEYDTFNQISIPSPFERHYCQWGEIRNPNNERKVIDFYRFFNASYADTIVKIASTVKRISEYKLIVGAFYGYITELTADHAHCGVRTILESDSIDFLASPFSYIDNRAKATDWFFFGSIESAKRAGKLWFMEADIRTNLTKPVSECFKRICTEGINLFDNPVWSGPSTEKESCWHIIRSFSKSLFSGAGLWWFDMWGGWYNSKGFMNLHSKLKTIYQNERNHRLVCSKAEVAVFIDDEFAYLSNPNSNFYSECIRAQMKELGYIGTPYDYWYLGDLTDDVISKYKLIILLSPVYLSCSIKETLNRWKHSNHTIIYVGYPDIYSGDMSLITGISYTLNYEDTYSRPQLVIEDNSVSLIKKNDSVVGAIKIFPEYQSIWYTEPNIKAKEICAFAELSGVHIYSRQGDIIYADNEMVSFTSIKNGVSRLYIGRSCTLKDEITGVMYKCPNGYCDFHSDLDETRLFRIIE